MPKFGVMIVSPIQNELPSLYADRIGQTYAKTVTSTHKKDNGQFFTPSGIAYFMADLSVQAQQDYKILDPGCGAAILSCALVEKLSLTAPNSIELVVYETDLDILEYTRAVLEYLKVWVEDKGIGFNLTLKSEDFVISNKDTFSASNSLVAMETGSFDIVISNPPYFKIPKEDPRAVVAKSIVWGQPNIYSIFMMVAARLLRPEGELIFIVPRSFASGNYFRAFREAFFQEIQINRIHLFDSRTDTFERDKVLQELLILKGTRSQEAGNILLTHSTGVSDISECEGKVYRVDELVNRNSREQIIHLPVTEQDFDIIKLFQSWKGSLASYNIKISTGPVVSFRATEYLHEQYRNGTVMLSPLYQLVNTSKMKFAWPVSKRNKAQYIQLCDETRQLMIPNKDYVFLRRFSSKDDKSRLVATPYFADSNSAELIGVENHLNYIYRPDGVMTKEEVLGIAALLNSSLFDLYFRTFNGNINVSATELREMPFPPLDLICSIGMQVQAVEQKEIVDDIVNSHFEIEHIFTYDQN